MSYIGNQPTSVAFLTDQFSGTGSQTAFTLSAAPANTASIIVAVSGVLQDPSTYSTAGLTLTFSAAPPSGTGNISVRFLGIPASNIATTAYRTTTEFTATAGQTTFSVPSYTVGYIDVYRNGALLGSADYTATNGTTVVLANAASSGDLVETISFFVSSVLNAIPAVANAVTTSYINDGAITTAKIAAGAVVQADLATGVAGTGPAFAAYANSTTTLTADTFVKVTFGVEVFDTNNNFASSRFTPTVAGYYQVNACLNMNFWNGIIFSASIYKNGSLYNQGQTAYPQTVGGVRAMISSLVYCDGSTDYIEIYGYQYAASSNNVVSATQTSTWFNASLVRAA
jgi:hypothetical protein